jgi:hypothetical protein
MEMRNVAFALTLTSLVLVVQPARADPPRPTQVKATNASAVVTDASTAWWGWILVGSGIVIGGTLSTYGLSLDCGEDERSCNKRAAITLWTGIGVAALASAIGIAVVQSASR